MEHNKQIEILSELLRQLDEHVNVDAGVILRNPTFVYTCSDIANREWNNFFQDHKRLICPISGSKKFKLLFRIKKFPIYMGTVKNKIKYNYQSIPI